MLKLMNDAAVPFATNERRKLPWEALALAGAAAADLSFLPPTIKHALHTRGVLHPWYHVLAFAALAAVFLSNAKTARARLLLPLAAVAVGWGTELAQAAIYRYSLERLDVAADSLGVLVGTLVFLLVRRSADTRTSTPWSAPVV